MVRRDQFIRPPLIMVISEGVSSPAYLHFTTHIVGQVDFIMSTLIVLGREF
jgi:hypothetical protein